MVALVFFPLGEYEIFITKTRQYFFILFLRFFQIVAAEKMYGFKAVFLNIK